MLRFSTEWTKYSSPDSVQRLLSNLTKYSPKTFSYFQVFFGHVNRMLLQMRNFGAENMNSAICKKVPETFYKICPFFRRLWKKKNLTAPLLNFGPELKSLKTKLLKKCQKWNWLNSVKNVIVKKMINKLILIWSIIAHSPKSYLKFCTQERTHVLAKIQLKIFVDIKAQFTHNMCVHYIQIKRYCNKKKKKQIGQLCLLKPSLKIF